jgi:hypothetical protein
MPLNIILGLNPQSLEKFPADAVEQRLMDRAANA